jgi:hypothetical protein
MKNYLLFAGDIYYPRGGFHDFCGDFSSIEECEKFATSQNDRWMCGESSEWYHIFDVSELKVVVARRRLFDDLESWYDDDDVLGVEIA